VGVWESIGPKAGTSPLGSAQDSFETVLILHDDGTFDLLVATICPAGAGKPAFGCTRIDETTGHYGVARSTPPAATDPLAFQNLVACDAIPDLYRNHHDSSEGNPPPAWDPVGSYVVSADHNQLTILYPGGHLGGPSGPNYGPSTQTFTRAATPSIAPGACWAANAPLQFDSADVSSESNNGSQFCVTLKDQTTQCAPIP
jgi:hypothetical protein